MNSRVTFGLTKGRATAALAVSLVCLASSAGAADSGQAGGTGGTSFHLKCGAGEALIGVTGKAKDLVDSVRGVCATFDAIRETIDVDTTAKRGGSGGQSYELRCPSGHVVVGLKGRAGWFVDQLKIVCSPLGADGKVDDVFDETVPFRAGGNGGSPFSVHCPNDLPANGLKGRSASFIDRIGLSCERTAIPAFVPPSGPIQLPNLRVVVHGLPFRVQRDDVFSYTVQLWNVGSAPAPEGTELDLESELPLAFPLLEVPFLGHGGCDVHDLPPAPAFVRCETNGPTQPGDFLMGVTVTAEASYTGTYDLSGNADPRNLVSEGLLRFVAPRRVLPALGELNNRGTATMRVVD